MPSSSVHIRCRAAAGRPESLTLTLALTLTLTLTLSLTLNLLNLTLSLKLTSVLTHRPSYAKWRHSSRDQSAASAALHRMRTELLGTQPYPFVNSTNLVVLFNA